MKTVNAMQLKAKVKARAKAAGVSPQLLMQDYMLERLIERISLSEWRDRVIVKGGMLIASLVGLDNRVTKDLDTTVRGFTLTHESATEAFREIISIEIDDDVSFEFVRTEDIREGDDYPGIRVFLKANYQPMSIPISIDVTTGDAITPGAVLYDFPLTFEGRCVPLMTYPLATCMAEKLETVITRGRANTRPRDYYDIRMLWMQHRHDLNCAELREALRATCAKRKSTEAMTDYRKVMEAVSIDKPMLGLWDTFSSNYSYARGISLSNACETVCEIMDTIGWQG